MMAILLSAVLALAISAGSALADDGATLVEAEGTELAAADPAAEDGDQGIASDVDELVAMDMIEPIYEKNIELGKEYSRTAKGYESYEYYFTVNSASTITVKLTTKTNPVEAWLDTRYEHYNSSHPYDMYFSEYLEGKESNFTKKVNIPEGKYRFVVCIYNKSGGSYTFSIDNKPTWSGASSLPVGATADVSVTNGGYIRLKSGGKWVTSDGVLSLSAPSTTTKRITAKAAGTTTLYLLNSSAKQVASKKVTVYAIHGKTWELESSVDKSYVLDIQGGSKKDGAQMIVYKRNGGDNQRYQMYRQDDGTYAIRSLKSKKWLTVEPKTNKYVQQLVARSVDA